MPTVADDIQEFIEQARDIAQGRAADAGAWAAEAIASTNSIHPVNAGFSISYNPGSALKTIDVPNVPEIKIDTGDFQTIASSIRGTIIGVIGGFMSEFFPNEAYGTSLDQLSTMAKDGIKAAEALLTRLGQNSGTEGMGYLKGRLTGGELAREYTNERFDAGRAASGFLTGKFASGGSAATYLINRFTAGDAAATQLIAMLTSGGTSLPAAVEDMVWQRDRARILKDAQRAENQVIDGFAARGFPMPPGAMAGVLEMAQAETQDKIAAQSRDVAIKQIDTLITNIREAAQIAANVGMEAGRTLLGDATTGGTVTLQDAQAAARLTFEDALQAARSLLEDSLATARTVVESASQAAAEVVRQRNGALEAAVGYIRAIVSANDAAASVTGAIASAKSSALNAGASYYSAQASAANAFNNGYVAIERLRLDSQIAPAQLTVQQNEGNNRTLVGIAQVRAQATIGAAEAVSHIAAAAMSSLNAIVSHQQTSST